MIDWMGFNNCGLVCVMRDRHEEAGDYDMLITSTIVSFHDDIDNMFYLFQFY
jgi:hypothetical protein